MAEGRSEKIVSFFNLHFVGGKEKRNKKEKRAKTNLLGIMEIDKYAIMNGNIWIVGVANQNHFAAEINFVQAPLPPVFNEYITLKGEKHVLHDQMHLFFCFFSLDASLFFANYDAGSLVSKEAQGWKVKILRLPFSSRW